MTYVATRRSTVGDKMRTYVHFHKFLESDFNERVFNKWFYRRLGTMFGLSRHFCRMSFYNHWFSTDNRRYEFIKKVLEWECSGDPALCYSDVERDIQKLLKRQKVLEKYKDRAIAEWLKPGAGNHLTVPAIMTR